MSLGSDAGQQSTGGAAGARAVTATQRASQPLGLLAMRIAWWAVLTLTLALFVALLPLRLSELRDTFGNLSPAQELVLEEMGVAVSEHAGWVLAIESVIPVAFIALAALIYLRKPYDRVAVSVSISLVSFIAFLDPLFDSASPTDSPWYLPAMAVQAVGWFSALAFFLVFPNGRFVPSWTRFLVPVLGVCALIWVLFPESPFNLSDLYRLPLAVFVADLIPWLVGIAAQIYRYMRVASPVERQQTKLALFGITITLVAYFVFAFDRFATPILARPTFAAIVYDLIGVPVFLILSLLTPASLAVCIFRYRLWDIDVLIGRTLVYGALTAILAGLYTASIGLSQRLFVAFTGAKSDAAIVVTTLIVASAFTPAKTALQSVVDRYFKLRPDPMARVIAFRERVRGFAELMDSEQLIGRALEEAATAFGAAGGAVYLQEGGEVRPVYTHGDWSQREAMGASLASDGPWRGRLVLGPRRNGLDYTAEDRKLFEDLVALVGQAIDLAWRSRSISGRPASAWQPARSRSGQASVAEARGELML